MNLKFILILGLPIVKATRKEFVGLLEKHIIMKQKAFVVTANPEIVMHSLNDPEYNERLKKADYITADGIGIVKAAKMLGEPLPERVSGFDIMIDLFQLSEKQKYSVYLLGATETVLQSTIKRVKKIYPDLHIAGHRNGYFDMEDTSVIEDIKNSGADLIFVAIGCPRQEKWISEYIDQADKGIFMGVGGAFDVLSGIVKRAPDKWIDLNLEWFYRFMKQPSRWRRMLYLPHFASIVVLRKIFKKNE